MHELTENHHEIFVREGGPVDTVHCAEETARVGSSTQAQWVLTT